MYRLIAKPDRGATAVLFALTLLGLVGAVGLAVDMGANYAKRQELQNAADAAVLAAVQELALGGSMEDAEAKVDGYARDNMGLGDANVAAVLTPLTPARARVDTAGMQEHWFISALGIEESRITASATAEWGEPVAGISMLPLTISICSYYEQFGADPLVGGEYNFTPSQPNGEDTCDWHDLYPPGGFGWLKPGSGLGCKSYTDLDEPAPGDTGNNVPNPCSHADFKKLVDDETVFLLPVFYDYEGTGSSGKYHLDGYAAIVLKGFHFNTLSGGNKSYGAPCMGGSPKTCLKAEFRGYVGPGDSFELGPGEDAAIKIIRLID